MTSTRSSTRTGRARSTPFLAVALLVGALTFAAGPATPTAAALPAEFTDALVVGGLDRLTTVRGMPDGTVVVLEQSGRVLVVPPGSNTARVALALSVCDNSERGLLGIAFDPEFITSGFVYLYTTRNVGGTCMNRVSRFFMGRDRVIDPASEVILLDNIPSTGGNHNGGDLNFGSDGYLYVAVGDAGTDPRGNSGSAGNNDAAQDLSLLVGKVLRITSGGVAVPENPFANHPNAVDCRIAGLTAPANGRCREIFAWGLRNPYRTPFDPNRNDTRFFINDVGQSSWEEVNEGGIGRDYGWNSREGACLRGSTVNCPPPPDGVTDPITAYSHAATGCSYITGGAFVPGGWWTAAYDGNYLFADGGCRKVFRRTAAGTVDYGAPFATLVGSPTDMAFVSWGQLPSLFYVTQQGQLRRITRDASTPTPSGPLAFSAVNPTRVFDSRNGTGGAGAGPLRAGTTRLVDVQAPGPSVAAALVNITLTGSVGPTFIQVRQPAGAPALTSVLNASFANELVANAAIVPLDSQGRALLATSTTTQLVVDVLGYFSATPGSVAAGRILPVEPARLVDTRLPNGDDNSYGRLDLGGPLNPAQVSFPATNRLGVPATGVAAVVLVVTGIDRSPGGGFVTVHAGGTQRPLASNLNTSFAGDIRANLAVVPVGDDGTVRAYLEGVSDVVIDVAGWVTNASVAAGTEGRLVTVPPQRLVDTRIGQGFTTFTDGADRTLGPPVPPDSIGVLHNLTLTMPTRATYITATPAGGPLPLASNVVAVAPNQTRAALALTRLSGSGQVRYHSQYASDLVVDLAGYLTGPG